MSMLVDSYEITKNVRAFKRLAYVTKCLGFESERNLLQLPPIPHVPMTQWEKHKIDYVMEFSAQSSWDHL